MTLANSAAAAPSWSLGGFFSKLLDTSDFPARWNCGTWTAQHGYLHIFSDLGIWSAYMAIPLALGFFVMRRPDIPFTRVFWLFMAFIFACGTGHLIEAMIFYWPVYRLSGVVKLTTAIVSWATVLVMIPLIPKALVLPGLATINRKLEMEVRERESAQEALRMTNEQLMERNREIERFAYSASHDLRSPLVTFSGFLNCLKEDLESGDQKRIDEDIASLDRGVRRMEKSINEVLELSRRGNIQLEPVELDMNGLIGSLVREQKVALGETGIDIVIASDLPSIVADQVKVLEVFENLIGNAAKYGQASQNPKIEIGGANGDDEARFYVRDHGPGIKAEDQKKIFEMFQRATQEKQGSGVGLASVTQIMEKHGGRVWVESEVGRGATFWLVFPTQPVHNGGAESSQDGRRDA